MNEKKQYHIFASGYCRIVNSDQEKDIEQMIRTASHTPLIINHVQLPTDDLSFFMCTSAAEKIFEQSKTYLNFI